MSTLLVHEIETEVVATVSPDKITNVYAIRPHLYRHGSPAGTVKLEIRQSDGGLIATSDTFNITAIGSSTYWHGYVRFIVDAQLQKNTSYQIAVVAGGGYSFSESGYVGWVKALDHALVPGTYASAIGTSAPLDLEIWERVRKPRGVT